MRYNSAAGLSHAELLELAAEAIVREWSGDGALGDCTGNGVTIEEARAAVARNFVKQQRLGPELARAEAEAYLWAEVVDITDRLPDPPGPEWTVYLDHGVPVLGRVEAL